MTLVRVMVTAVAVLVVAGLCPATAQQSAPPAPGQAAAQNNAAPAAKVGGDVITLGEVEQAGRAQLSKLDEQRQAILEEKLDEIIGQKLLAQEAKKRGLSVEDLLKAEVYGKAPEVPDSEVTSFMTQNKARLPQMDEATLKMRIWDYLRAQKVNERRQAYVQSLRSAGDVTVYLTAPVVRVSVSSDGTFVRGAKDAPVTIVEFSDFQCPFCKSATNTVKQVLDKYPGKVKLVFRDFPIPSLHPAAPKAHEAARCAADQGKFWEYHDVLFEKSPKQSPEDLKQYAKDLKLDTNAFTQCLDSGKHEAAVNKDIQEGSGLGVTGTPTFFINGRQLVGSQPITAFQKIVDSELAKK